jgi:hypothetical protein
MDKAEYELRLKELESRMEAESGNKAKIRELRQQKSEVGTILKRVERSIDKMKVIVGFLRRDNPLVGESELRRAGAIFLLKVSILTTNTSN